MSFKIKMRNIIIFKGLPYELQDYVEDTSEYVVPQEGNFVYKLFSLQDLLLLVRCSIQRIETRPRYKKRKKIRRVSCYLWSWDVVAHILVNNLQISNMALL